MLIRQQGITIGAVVVPQGMAYAKLAELPVQYGLYTAFMGTLIYWIFATSKDITIGVSKPYHASDKNKVLMSRSPSLSCPRSLVMLCYDQPPRMLASSSPSKT